MWWKRERSTRLRPRSCRRVLLRAHCINPRTVAGEDARVRVLLGLVLERATGTPVATYLQDRLWKPLGMEYEGSWSLDGEDTAFPKMESGINGRAIDFAKFGQIIFVWPHNRVVIVRNGAAEGVSLGRWFRLLSGLADRL